MKKQGNANSELLDQLLKAASNAQPKEYRNDLAHQIMRILDQPNVSLDDVLRGAFKQSKANKIAQAITDFEDPAADLDPAAAAADPATDPLAEGGEDPLAPDPAADPLAEGGEDPLADPAATGGAAGGSIAEQLRSLADQVEALEGGGEGDLGADMGEDALPEEAGIEDELGAPTGPEESVAGPTDEELSNPLEDPAPMQSPAPMLMAHSISPNGKRRLGKAPVASSIIDELLKKK